MNYTGTLEFEHGLTLAIDGARVAESPLELLRDGAGDQFVFLFPGTGGEACELAPLAERLTAPGRIFGLSYLPESESAEAVNRQATYAVAALRRIQPHGPYRLVGYSFGALVAVEAARQLRRAGEWLEPPILIDAFYDQKFWPAKAWWIGQARRTGTHLVQIRRQPPAMALREFAFRAGRLAQRFWSRWQELPPVYTTSETTIAAANIAALRAYAPSHYPGALALVEAAETTMFGCRPSDLWRPLSRKIVVEDITGDHHDLVRNPTSLKLLGRAVDRHLAQSEGQQPLALIVTTFRWPATAGLAKSLTRAGFRVAALCPRRHPMRRQSNSVLYRLPWLYPERTLKSLIECSDPDLILPCDEPALDLVRSSGGGGSDISRSEMIDIALATGVDAPPMRRVDNLAELDKWIEEHGFPVVLKTDGSWGGRGVAIVNNRPAAVREWRRLARGPSPLGIIKRAIVNGNPNGLRNLWHRRRPCINAQVYVAGRDANVALAVKDGSVLAAVAVEVLETKCKNGPATIVRVIEHPGIVTAATKIMEKLRLTGLVGIDFILDAEGVAHLIEVNARVTPTCRLALGSGRDPVTALRSLFPGGATPAAVPNSTGSIIDLAALD
ncbi:ATP-grasp domain-containing protein [bacterium M00.F.Ca.ET.230.01.1.1]|nr:ATP-grasp domain-containing protein [bacterium M00.F.Ca.ET.230.01.1.1]